MRRLGSRGQARPHGAWMKAVHRTIEKVSSTKVRISHTCVPPHLQCQKESSGACRPRPEPLSHFANAPMQPAAPLQAQSLTFDSNLCHLSMQIFKKSLLCEVEELSRARCLLYFDGRCCFWCVLVLAASDHKVAAT